MAEKVRGMGAGCVVLASGVGLLVFTANRADASLVIDVRSTVAGSGSKLVTGAKVGDVVTMDVVAQVTGTDTTANDGIQSILGSFASMQTSGNLQGNFSIDGTSSPWAPTTTFNNNGAFQAGKVQDLNGLPGLDLGSIGASSDPSASDYVQARAGAVQVGVAPGTAAAPDEFTLGSVSFKITSGSGNVSLNWYPLVSGGGLTVPAGGGYDANAAIWREDGTNKRPTTGGILSSGQPIVVQVQPVPEPASLGLLGLASAGLLARRRRTR